ncbi:MAG: hypothetical protein AAF570_21390, partial [Bacteroidota bacterium]
RDSVRVFHGRQQIAWRDETLFIPYYAIAVGEGRHKLQLELHVRDLKTGRVVGKSDPLPFAFEKPEVQLFQVRLQDIYTEETDDSGETWDYQFLNPREIQPDIRWGIKRGDELVFQSDRQKNSTHYEGDPEEDVTPHFSLSEGDHVTIFVYDFDMISFSDRIGTLSLDPWAPDAVLSRMEKYTFGRVKEAVFAMEALNKPSLDITRFDLIEGVRENGVMGMRLKFDYKIQRRLEDSKYLVHMEQIWGDVHIVPSFARVLRGPAVMDEEDEVELLHNEGQVEVFVPQYGLLHTAQEGSAPLMRLIAKVQLGDRNFDLGHRQQQIMRPLRAIEDLEFGQCKVSQQVHRGVHGVQISFEYRLSDQYFDDLDRSRFALRPKIKTNFGPAALADMDLLSKHELNKEATEIALYPDNDSGVVDLFMPYYLLPPDHKSMDIRVEVDGLMVLRKDAATRKYIGKFDGPQVSLELPEIRMRHFAVREIQARKERWMITNPNLQWRVLLGDQVMNASRIAYNSRRSRWTAEEQMELV